MKSAKQLREEIAALSDRVQAIAKLAEIENRDLKDDEVQEIDRIQGVGDKTGEIQALQADLARAEKIAALAVESGKARGEQMLDAHMNKGEKQAFKVPAKAKAVAKITAFKTEEDAYKMGQWVRATIGGSKRAREFCRDQGIKIQGAMTTGDNTKGSFLVPEPLENSIIELREQFGVFRRYAQPWQMSDAVQIVPKLSGEVTSYYVGENSSITASDMTVNQIRLEAKKLAALTVISSELNEDSVISIAEMLARSVAYKFSYDEDNAGFNGDGTSTYGGIVGLSGALAAGSKVTATSRTTFSALTAADFEGCIGKAKMWAGYSPAWFISQNGWANSMQRLLDAVGGNNIGDLAMGAPKMFLGYPVVISQVLNSALTGTTGTAACYFGDLRLGAYLGTRRGISVAADSSVYFAQDAVAVRATQRYDINVHDRGDASNAGGLIQLVFG